jgi:hypothetical protein
MSDVIDAFTRAALSPVDIAIRHRAARRIPEGTRCRATGGMHALEIVGPPDARNHHPVRLTTAGGQSRVFSLPAISLTPIGDAP